MNSAGDHIEITPGIAGGKPRIAGHRVFVADIAVWHERLGRGVDEIASEYDLSLGDVHAALTYYFDHRVEMDRQIEQDDMLVRALRAKTRSKVTERLRELQRDGTG